jgi:hypothetical protein
MLRVALLLLRNMQERVNATRPPSRIAMTSVDIAAFDDAEYLWDVAAVALIVGPAVKFGLVPPQPPAGAARSGCGVSRNARYTGQLLSRARGQRAESRRKIYGGRVWE